MPTRSTITDAQRERLSALRKRKGLSMGALAKVLGISVSHVSNVEAGKGGISVDLAQRWAIACGGTLADLMGSERRATLVRALNDMPDDQLNAFWKLLRITNAMSDDQRTGFMLMLEAMEIRMQLEIEAPFPGPVTESKEVQ